LGFTVVAIDWCSWPLLCFITQCFYFKGVKVNA